VTAPIVDRRDLDVSMIPSPIRLLVFDAQVGEMDLIVEVREVVLVRPFLDLVRLTIGPSSYIVAVSIPPMQPSLVVALELVVEDDTFDACPVLREAISFAEVGAIHLGVVFQLARLLEPRVELLATVVRMASVLVNRVVAPVRLQHVPTFFRQHDSDVPMTVQTLGSDGPLVPQMS
jgi:hypothetical protein